MAKFEKQLFNNNKIFGMTLLHAHAQFIYIVMRSIRNLH